MCRNQAEKAPVHHGSCTDTMRLMFRDLCIQQGDIGVVAVVLPSPLPAWALALDVGKIEVDDLQGEGLLLDRPPGPAHDVRKRQLS